MSRPAMLRRSSIPSPPSSVPELRRPCCPLCFWFLLVGRESVSDTTGSVTVSWWLCLGPRLSLSLCRWNIHSATLVLGWDLGSGLGRRRLVQNWVLLCGLGV